MKKSIIGVLFTLFAVSIFALGCTQVVPQETPALLPAVVEQPEPEQPVVEEPTQTELGDEDPQEESVIEAGRFTIRADEALKEPLSALYGAVFNGEVPLFVEDNADLLAASADAGSDERPVIHATFLPGQVLIPESDLADVDTFIDFAISPDGQQVLIEAGALPEFITITDQTGVERVIPQPVRRVIVAYGPATGIVYSVNAGDRLVAASYLGARDPQGSAAMERIDPRFQSLVSDDYFSQQEFNLEHAATLDPDLVIAGARSPWADSVTELGIPIFLMEAETPEQLKEAVQLIGQMFGPHAAAQSQAWVAYYDWVVENILAETQQIPTEERVRVLFTGTDPLRIASGDMYQTDVIESAGGISVSTELSGYWNDVNMEQVAIWDPDVIIVPPYGGASVAAITDSSEWQILTAVQEGQVFRMPKLVVPWDTPAPDSVLGIIWMAERLNPDLIAFSCAEESEFFYNTFYNYAISGDEIAAICAIE
jgi:iron complex transport system substrate-binding protein